MKKNSPHELKPINENDQKLADVPIEEEQHEELVNDSSSGGLSNDCPTPFNQVAQVDNNDASANNPTDKDEGTPFSN